jgi:protein gp37
MGDLFDPQLPAAFVDKVFETMLACRQHQFMLLTKRYERVNETVEHFVENREDSIRDDAFNHIHFGFTATNHDEIETGIINFGFDFISLEPLLDDVCLSEIGTGNGYTPQFNPIKKMKLVVAGGINPGKPLHEAHPEWLDRIIDDCNSLGVPLHYKHQGKNPEFNGKTYNAMIDGRVGK